MRLLSKLSELVGVLKEEPRFADFAVLGEDPPKPGCLSLAIGPGRVVVYDESVDSLQSLLGLRAHTRLPVSETTWFSPEFFANWLHEFGDVEREFRARFSGAAVDAPLTILGAEVDRDSLLGGFRLISASSQGASAELAYTALWNQQQLEHALSLGFQLVW